MTHTETFHRIAELCARTGWSLGVHAVGGKAIDIALAVFEEVDRKYPIRDLRFSLIHAYIWPTPANVETARRCLGNAQAIVAELMSSLDVDAWEGAPQLFALYGHLTTTLVRAAISNDAELTRGCA